MSRLAVDRNDGSLAFEQMAEAKDRSMFVLDVVSCGDGDIRVAQHFAGGCQSVARIDLASILFSQHVEWRLRIDALRAEPCDQILNVVLTAVMIIERGGIGRR